MGVALAVGDTAGHAYPALAVAEAFRAADPTARVVFFGTADSIAAGILAREGETLVAVPGAPIRRAGAAGLSRAAFVTTRSIRTARALLRDHAIELAIGFGGFSSGGVLVAARSIGAMTAIHELNVEPGLANAWLRHVVHQVYVACPEAQLPGTDVGTPVRRAIAALAGHERSAPGDTLRVLAMTGSRGSTFFNAVLPSLLEDVVRTGVRVELLQQTGDEGSARIDDLEARYAAAGVSATLVPFLDDMPHAYRWAHVALARAGASTVAELAMTAMPAVLVPLGDAAADHQAPNAERWQQAGAGLSVPEHAWQPGPLVEWLRGMRTEPARWRAASGHARALARPGAAERLVAACQALLPVHA